MSSPPAMKPHTSSSATQDPHTQPRRPRGFAAQTQTDSPTKGSKREREKEKERTKLRERHRRAITSRMLAGLRQYGNFPLPARADMNDVLAALAREAGWTVDADGTTYRQFPAPPAVQNNNNMAQYPNRSVDGGSSGSSLKNCPFKSAYDCHPLVKVDESLSPASLDSSVIGDRDSKNEKYPNASPVNSVDCLDAEQLMQDVHCQEHGNDYKGTPYVPVYVLLSPSTINNFCQLVDPEGLRQELNTLVSLNADGVVVTCWWGIVECWSPQKYVWSGYRELFNIVKEFKMKVQVVMAFHENLDNDNSDVLIRLPQWVLEIGKDNPDIFFTDREGRRNTECLSWGIDKERVLKGRTGVEVYFDFMRSFRTEFDSLFAEGIFSAVEIGLGGSGELKYPSFPERMGWRYPGIGEFQCYDKYLQQNLRKAARLRGHSFWARGPDNAGQYNSRPYETGFFCERGDYDSYYGRFFLQWYSQLLKDHADNVLSLSSLAFEEINIIVKVPAIYWWYRTVSHAAELTAGYYNSKNQDGYFRVFEILKKHSVTMKFVCSGLYVDNDEALADPEGVSWQVVNSAWDQGLSTAGENSVSHYRREDFMKMVDIAKPRTDPDQRHFSFFVYRHPPSTQRTACLSELDFLIKKMHGEMNDNHGHATKL